MSQAAAAAGYTAAANAAARAYAANAAAAVSQQPLSNAVAYAAVPARLDHHTFPIPQTLYVPQSSCNLGILLIIQTNKN